MNYILDTNICIHMLNHKSLNILRHAKKKSKTNLYLSTITEAKLWYGVSQSSRVDENAALLKRFLELFPKIAFDSSFAKAYGSLRSLQKRSGKNIGHNDLFIAVQAIEMDAILVTANEKEFKQIKGLKSENWLHATA